jgi:hypothetical protein
MDRSSADTDIERAMRRGRDGRVPGKQDMAHLFRRQVRAGGESGIAVAAGAVLRREGSPLSADT